MAFGQHSLHDACRAIRRLEREQMQVMRLLLEPCVRNPIASYSGSLERIAATPAARDSSSVLSEGSTSPPSLSACSHSATLSAIAIAPSDPAAPFNEWSSRSAPA